MNEYRIHARTTGMMDQWIGIWIAEGFGENLSLCTNLIFEKANPAVDHQPSISIDLTQAQVLIDELWNCGLRPTEGKGSAGQLTATEKHLNDMRGLVDLLVKKVLE
jgi:hypothetical protein